MTPPGPPLVLLVDDDVSVHERVRALLPTGVPLVSAYSAAQGIDRCRRLLAERPGATMVLVLDFRLPDMDGGLLAAKLRELLPDAPLIALSSVSESVPVMQISGMTRALSKRVSDEALRAELALVLAQPVPARPDPVLAPYLAGHATTMARLRPEAPGVAVLASARPLGELLSETLRQAGVAVGATSTTAPALQSMLPTMPVRALLCDGPVWSRARALAAAHQLPLLVVAMALSTAIGLSIEPVSVLVAPEPGELARALDIALAGGAYRDRRIAAAYDALELTPAERAVLPYIVRDLPIEQAAHALGLSESAVRKARGRALARLNAERLDDVRIALDELLAG